jgi:signal transduction histidine kinase
MSLDPHRPRSGANGLLNRLSIESLLWAMGLFCAFTGSFVLVAPHHFRTPVYEALRLHGPWWGTLAVVSGSGLLAVAILRLPRRWSLTAHTLAGLSLLALAASFGLTLSWTGAIAYTVLGLGTLAAGLLPRSLGAASPAREGDFFALLMGLVAAANGLLLLIPENLPSPAYDPVRASLPWLGAFWLATGLPLIYAQLRPGLPPRLLRGIHFCAGLAFMTFGMVVAQQLRFWTGVALYVGCGAGLAFLPWLRRKVSRLDAASLRTRLAFSLSATAVVALVSTAAVATYREEALAEEQVIETRQIEAQSIARNIADYVDLSGVRTALVASLAGRAPYTPETQHALLASSQSIYPEITAFLALDPAARTVAWSGDPPPLPPETLRRLVAQRLRQPVARVEALLPPGIEPPVLIMSMPVVAADNRVAGLLVAVLGADSLAQRLIRPGSNVYLADGHGRRIAEQRSERLEALPLGWDREVRLGRTHIPGERVAGFARVPSLDWAVAVESSRAESLAGVYEGRNRAFLLLLLLLPLTVLGGIFVARRIAQPLRSLSGAVGQLRDGDGGDLTAPLEFSGITEVDHLSTAFDDMRERLAERTRESGRLAAELRARAEALADSDRRKDEFLAMLAHELRNPLGAIANASYLLEQVGPGQPQGARSVAIIRRQIQHLVRMVDDLLDVSRITRGKVELRRAPLDLREVVHHAVETTRPLMEAKGHAVEVVLPDEPVPLFADVTRLEQVLANLLRNAAKYTGEGGQIEVAVRRTGNEAMLVVCDNGIGIAPELLPRVFDLFTQGEQDLDRSGAGLGIGLTLVRRLVEMHGGRVEARSDGPGRGTEVLIWLPIGESVEEGAEQKEMAEVAGRTR